MIRADDSFLDRLCDTAAQPVNPSTSGGVRHLRGALEVWTALTLYHNAVHGHTHLRTSLIALICVHLR